MISQYHRQIFCCSWGWWWGGQWWYRVHGSLHENWFSWKTTTICVVARWMDSSLHHDRSEEDFRKTCRFDKLSRLRLIPPRLGVRAYLKDKVESEEWCYGQRGIGEISGTEKGMMIPYFDSRCGHAGQTNKNIETTRHISLFVCIRSINGDLVEAAKATPMTSSFSKRERWWWW